MKDNSGSLQLEKASFPKGETFQSTHPKYEGLAFTIGNRVDNSFECEHVWMKADKTYLCSKLKELGHEWVLLMHHRLIPRNNMIELKYLQNSVKLADMNVTHAICYDEESSSSLAFYFQLGDPLNSSNQTMKPPKAMDLCAGGGGMSVGMRNAGFNVKYKVRLKFLCAMLSS